MTKLHVMIGLPGVGKSRLVDELEKSVLNPFIYSTDSYIETRAKWLKSTYDKEFTDNIKIAISLMNDRLISAIKYSKQIIWDQTNLSSKKRRSIMNSVPETYTKIGYCILPPFSTEEMLEWNRRLDSREGKTIPKYIMTSMMGSYQTPSLDEGFDQLYFYNMYGVLQDA